MMSVLVYNLRACSGVTIYSGAFHTELMQDGMVSSMMNCFKTDPIISRPVPGSSCKRHKVLVLNPVSAANLTLLIGCMVVCEHLGPHALPLNTVQN